MINIIIYEADEMVYYSRVCKGCNQPFPYKPAIVIKQDGEPNKWYCVDCIKPLSGIIKLLKGL